jgi:hypothetical protein
MLLSFLWAARQLVNLPVYSDAIQLAVDLRDLRRCYSAFSGPPVN